MTTNSTDALEILEAQHSEIDMLIEQLEDGGTDRQATFDKLADLLAAHATIEEKIFYPGVMAAKTADILRESAEEHLAVKRLLADMLALDPEADADEFDAKLSVLKEDLTHHAHEEEEDKLFPIVRKMLDEDQLDALGNEMLVMFESLIDAAPREHIPEETTEAVRL